jgi:hypothetical protein
VQWRDGGQAPKPGTHGAAAIEALASRLLKNSLPGGEPGMARGADQSLQVIDPTGASPDMRRTRDLRNARDVRFSTSC